MPKVNCAVIGCSNSTYRLNKWKKSVCEQHAPATKNDCVCAVPFKLFCFPSTLRNSRDRSKWVKLLRREIPGKKWEPCDSDRVCSMHFVNNEPTAEHPDPTENLGYENISRSNSRRTLYKHPPPQKDVPEPSASEYNDNTTTDVFMDDNDEVNHQVFSSPSLPLAAALPFVSPALSEHSYARTPLTKPCESCVDKSNLISSLVGKINKLSIKQKRSKVAVREGAFRRSSDFTWTKIKTDKKMNYYTGVSSILIFETLFLLLKPYLSKIRYWRGTKVARSWSKVKRSFRPSTKKVLTQKDEFLLTLMRLRLGLLNEDLADRFGISTTVCSNTFITMIRLLAKLLGKALVVWLPREPIYEHMPKSFKKAGHSKCRVIIDC